MFKQTLECFFCRLSDLDPLYVAPSFDIFCWELIQSTWGFETLDKAAALGLATATSLTDPRQYINSNLGFSNLKM